MGFLYLLVFWEVHCGLVVSALDSGSGGPGSSPGRSNALCSWARKFTLIVPLPTQVYKWVPANLRLGVTCDALASHPGGVEILIVASCYGNWDKLQPDGPLGLYVDLPLPFTFQLLSKLKTM